ncbi:MAG TPA: hypothetical protein VFT45_27670 [Longimicrobium sp.]|nr:hypothetical protein [Longimicrobium sp.]
MREGWLGDDYIILFSEEEATAASRRYGIGEALPGCTIIGLWGWDDFLVRDPAGRTFTVPTVPMSAGYQREIALPPAAPLLADDRFTGRIKWYVTPIIFGGDPEPGENLIWVSHDDHAALVTWWNARYHELQ